MKISLIGATGFVGSAILKEALSRRHQVTAILRHPEKLKLRDENLVVVQGDVMDTEKLASLLKGNEMVISAYNSGWDNPDIYNEFIRGARSIQDAVKMSGARRLIVMGGAGSLLVRPGLQIVDSPNFPASVKMGSMAARDYLNMLRDEKQVDWTYISPSPNMNSANSGKRTGRYRTGLDSPVFDAHNHSSISVEDLAVAALDEAENEKHSRQRFTVGY